MSTLTSHATAEKTTTSFSKQSTWTRLLELGEENRFGIIAISLLVVGCLGGITMMYGAAHSTAMLIAVVIPTMTTLSLLLAVAPIRLIYMAFGLTILTDFIVLLGLSL